MVDTRPFQIEAPRSRRRRGHPALVALVALLTLSARVEGGDAFPRKLPGTFAVRAGRIHTVSGGVLEPGVLVVRDGRLVAVCEGGVEIPAGAPLLDFSHCVIVPGLIDAETTLTSPQGESTRSLAPEVLAVDGWDFLADRTSHLRGGTTTVYVAPGVPLGSGKPARLLSGRGCVVKVAGHDDDPERRVLRRAAGVQVTLGESSKQQPSVYEPPTYATVDEPFDVVERQVPTTRAGAIAALRDLFQRARAFRAAARNPADFESDLELGALQPLLEGQDVLRVRAHRARDIAQALRLCDQLDVPMALEGAREAERFAAELARRGIPVILEGNLRRGFVSSGDLSAPIVEGLTREGTLLKLVHAGVRVALHSPTDGDVGDILLQAESAVRLGLEPEAALRSVTLDAARVLGVSDRIGSLEPGKDADFVVLAGEPFSRRGEPRAVFVGGELVYRQGPVSLGKDSRIIRCGTILDGLGRELAGGILVVHEGKIAYVGEGVLAETVFPDASPLDATGLVVVPGFIDSGSTAGTHAESIAPPSTHPSGTAGAGARPTFRLAEALAPDDPDFAELVRSGFTTVLVTPDPTGPVAGQISAWKLSGQGREASMWKPYAGLLVRYDLSSNVLKPALEYHKKWLEYESKTEPKGEAPRRDENLDVYRPLFEGKVPAVVYAQSPEALVAVAKSWKSEFGIRVVGFGPNRIDRVASELRGLGGAALLSVPFVVRDDYRDINVPQGVFEAGLPFGIRSGAGAGAAVLPAQVALAVRAGLDERRALASLTIEPARIFGIADRVGSLEEGKDADLVFLSGPPFDPTTRVVAVMVDGVLLYQREGFSGWKESKAQP